MIQEQADKSPLQTQLEDQQAISKPLISTERIEDSDFQLVTTPEGTFIAIGDYRITEILPKPEIYEMIATRDWRLIRAVIIHIAAKTIEKMELDKLEVLSNGKGPIHGSHPVEKLIIEE